jgi:hypothetical protein
MSGIGCMFNELPNHFIWLDNYICVDENGKFFFRTEDEDLLGPYYSREAAQAALDVYVEHLG